MADAVITITIPDAHVAAVKLAYEDWAIEKGELEAGQTFTLVQARDAIKAHLTREVRGAVKRYYDKVWATTAAAEAATETNVVILL